MCLAVPSRVIAVDGLSARVEAFGSEREVNLMLLEDEVVVGDYLLIQAGGFAFERLDAERAADTLALMQSILEEERGERAWGAT